MDKKLTYVIGYPASGKSTAVNLALPEPQEQIDVPVPYLQYQNGIQLGKARDEFAGTDAYSYNITKKVKKFLAETEAMNIIAEGDRLNNTRFFRHCVSLGLKLDIIYLFVTPKVAHQRAFKRKSTQDAVWGISRQTKVRNVAVKMKKYITLVNGERDIQDVVSDIKKIGAFRELNG